MPNSKQHKKKAEHNRAFLDSITDDRFADWMAVVAFYTAVHLVERLRTLNHNASEQHSRDHQHRREFVQSQHKQIHTAYHELFNASLIARYQTVNSFQTQLNVKDIKTRLINGYLAEIESYTAAKFSPQQQAT